MLEQAIIEILSRAASPGSEYVPASYECFVRETQRQAIPALLMLAVMKTEGGRIGTQARNTNGTLDLGPMQINTVHLQKIASITGRPISEVAQKLAHDACSNIAVGAWILRLSINDAGSLWKGVAYYHSRNAEFGTPYAWRVYHNMNTISARSQDASTSFYGEAKATLDEINPFENK